jgi:DNA polymerase-3 subunit alpha
MERRTKTGNKMGIIGLSDPTGQFEAVLFSEGLAQFRDMLEPGKPVLLQLGAELQGEDVRARIHGVEALDEAAAKTQMALRIFLRDDKPLDSIAKRLESVAVKGATGGGANGKAGDVTLIMPIDLETEVEMQLPGRFKVSPQIAGAIKAVPGVTTVELV